MTKNSTLGAYILLAQSNIKVIKVPRIIYYQVVIITYRKVAKFRRQTNSNMQVIVRGANSTTYVPNVGLGYLRLLPYKLQAQSTIGIIFIQTILSFTALSVSLPNPQRHSVKN